MFVLFLQLESDESLVEKQLDDAGAREDFETAEKLQLQVCSHRSFFVLVHGDWWRDSQA